MKRIWIVETASYIKGNNGRSEYEYFTSKEKAITAYSKHNVYNHDPYNWLGNEFMNWIEKEIADGIIERSELKIYSRHVN